MRVLVYRGADLLVPYLKNSCRGVLLSRLGQLSSGKRETLASFRGDLEILEATCAMPRLLNPLSRGMEWISTCCLISVPQSMLEPQDCFCNQRCRQPQRFSKLPVSPVSEK